MSVTSQPAARRPFTSASRSRVELRRQSRPTLIFATALAPEVGAQAASELFDIGAEQFGIGDAADVVLAEDGRLEHISILDDPCGVRYTRRMLLCPVRGCNLALLREERRLVCPRKHSFDVARSGYINLLQPQDRRSKRPGDTAAAIAARRRLHDRGVTLPLLNAISEIVAASSSDVVLDAGCGDGFYLGTLAGQTGFDAHGLDISIPSVDAAARRYPRCEWIVANADRFIPYQDRSFSIVLSITARMNSSEFRRILPTTDAS